MSPSDYFQPFIDWADGFGLFGLALVSASEAAFQPIPPDVLVIPMVIEANSVLAISLIVIVATLSSVFGVIATFLELYKYLVSWSFWIVINTYTIWLYDIKELDFLAIQMIIYTLLSIYGYSKWHKRTISVQKSL